MIFAAVWTAAPVTALADKTMTGGFVTDDTGKILKQYTGTGGNITIPAGITTINDSVFAGKTSITGVTLPTSVASIGANAFSGCKCFEKLLKLQDKIDDCGKIEGTIHRYLIVAQKKRIGKQ